MTTRTRVAIYARISQDRSGDALGVTRQLEDCRAEAKRRGWTVAEEYIDDDVSAYSGKARPAYDRMLRDIENGERDAIIAWHSDRLHRQPLESERFIAACERAGVTDVATLSGDIDLAKGDGLLMARLMVAVAANESDSKKRRGKRKALEIAESGRPVMGGPRPFGFLPDRVTHDPAEASVIREVAARVLAGEPLQSVARWLEAEGVRTVGGRPWRTSTIRNFLTNPRYWGMRVHNGQVIGEGTWEPIITPEQGERLVRLLMDPARRTNRTARRYLLSGMLRCGLCGGTLHSAPKNQVRRYGCSMGADVRGCGRIYIYAEMLEGFLAKAILMRLDTPEMLAELNRAPAGNEEAVAVAEQIEADTARKKSLAEDWADGLISRDDWLNANARIEPRLVANHAALARLTQRDKVAAYAGHGKELRERWDSLNLSRQVAIVKAVLDHAVILPATTPGRRGLDPDRVEPVWRA
jgi:DNA invertase Pin-like site-specific DNA recombinase